MIIYHALKYLLSPPHPDKVPNTMPHDLPSPSKLLHPILDKYSFDDSIAHAISMLKERLKFDVHTLRDLEAMNVTDVGQYRSEKVMHEHIVIQYAYQPNETQPPLPVDTRVGRFERYKCSSNKSDKLDSSPLVKEIIQASMNQVKLDNVRISNKVEMDSANVGVVQSHYCLLRSFAPLFGSLNFLQVLAIANAVSSVASEYSSLHHMCLWFATTFYLSIKKFISFDGRENISKDIISRLGMFRNVTLVNRDSGALTFGSTGTLGNLYANHFAQGVSRKDLEDLRKVIERDEILLRKEGNLQLLQVSSIVTAARLQQDLLYGFFRDQSQAVKDRLEEEEREREADRRRLEVAEAGQVAEHKRAEDERKRADAAEAGQAAALAEIATLRLLLENQKK